MREKPVDRNEDGEKDEEFQGIEDQGLPADVAKSLVEFAREECGAVEC